MHRCVTVSLIALMVSVLSACAENTGFVQIDADTYRYGKQDLWAHSGSTVKAEMDREAITFCASQGKHFTPGAFTVTDHLVHLAGAEIHFKCR